jgi:hypothetical protein
LVYQQGFWRRFRIIIKTPVNFLSPAFFFFDNPYGLIYRYFIDKGAYDGKNMDYDAADHRRVVCASGMDPPASGDINMSQAVLSGDRR